MEAERHASGSAASAAANEATAATEQKELDARLQRAEERAKQAEDQAQVLQQRLDGADARLEAALQEARREHAERMSAHAADSSVSRVAWPLRSRHHAPALTLFLPNSKLSAAAPLAADVGGKRVPTRPREHWCV